MHSVCFHFQISQPYRLRTYRFFDINENHHYFDDFQNNYITRRLAERCYLPANKMLLDLIHKYGDKFCVSFSMAGSSLKLFQEYCPEVIDSFKKLIDTGRVEITGNTFTHSLAALNNKTTFLEQIKLQEKFLDETFGVSPTSFCNTEIIYSDEIGEWIYEAGYKLALTGKVPSIFWDGKSPDLFTAILIKRILSFCFAVTDFATILRLDLGTKTGICIR